MPFTFQFGSRINGKLFGISVEIFVLNEFSSIIISMQRKKNIDLYKCARVQIILNEGF